MATQPTSASARDASIWDKAVPVGVMHIAAKPPRSLEEQCGILRDGLEGRTGCPKDDQGTCGQGLGAGGVNTARTTSRSSWQEEGPITGQGSRVQMEEPSPACPSSRPTPPTPHTGVCRCVHLPASLAP